MSELSTKADFPDFPKVRCPFIRKTYSVNVEDWKKHKSNLQMRDPSVYLVTQEIDPELDWVFEEDTFAVEKLHGSNFFVKIEDGEITHVQNRKNIVNTQKLLNRKGGLSLGGRLFDGVLHASELSLITNNSAQFGELLGPTLNGNIHKLNRHIWYPFDVAKVKLRYKSFEKYQKEFCGWSEWLRTGLKSLIYCRLNRVPLSDMWSNPEVPFTEGIVIYQEQCFEGLMMKGMAKLRRDMFDWYYGSDVEILGLEDWRVDLANKHGYILKGYN